MIEDLMVAPVGMPEGIGVMTGRERRIVELAAKDLDGWARELPIGSETRRDLQQTARAYRFAARVGAEAVAPGAAADERHRALERRI